MNEKWPTRSIESKLCGSRAARATAVPRFRPITLLALPQYVSSYLLAAFLLMLLAAATQPFAYLAPGRWVALGLLGAYCMFMFFSKPSINPRPVPSQHLNILVVPYLSICGLAAVFGVSPLLSGSKWVSFAAIVGPLMVVARTRLSLSEAREWLRVTLVLLLVGAPLVAIIPVQKQSVYEDHNLFRGAAGEANSMGHITALGLLALLLLRERLESGASSQADLTACRTCSRWDSSGHQCPIISV